MAQAAVPFALTPATLDDALIDYCTADGIKLYRAATTPLADKFDGEPEKTKLFLRDVAQHAAEHGLDGILQIRNNANVICNLVDNYGELTETNVRTNAVTYMTGQNNCNTQQAYQLYQFLYGSIGSTLQIKVTNEPQLYTVLHNGVGQPDGPLFLKAIVSKIFIDTRATTAAICRELSTLDAYMRSDAANGCNIEKFNLYVQKLINNLAARGETSTDATINLFKGYLAASNKRFVTFMEHQQERQMYLGANLPINEIMHLAQQYWFDRSWDGDWNKPSSEEQQIIALTAQLKQAKTKDGKQKGKKGKDKGKKKNKDKKEEDGKTRQRDNPKWAWKWVPPKPGEKTKDFGKLTYEWCPHHKQWCTHAASKCTLATQGQNKDKDNAQRLRATRALAAIIDDDDNTFRDE